MEEAKVLIGGKSYELLLSTKATQDIASRYGGLANLGDKLMQAENFEQAIDEVIWLVCELANQKMKLDSLVQNTEFSPLTEEAVAIMSTPADLPAFKDAIMVCLTSGMNRSIKSEETLSKNEVTE